MTEINQAKLLDSLFRYGHFWNPDKPNTLNVTQDDVATLTLQDSVAKEALASWQAFDVNFDALSLLTRLKNIIADGDAGPITAAMMDVPRCPIPDFAPPPNASFHYDDPGLQAAVESMQRAAAMGSGSWPSCDPQKTGVNSFRVNINTANIPGTVKAYLEKSLKAVSAAYAEVGCAVRYVLDGDPNDCEISKRFESLSGSVIGWNEFPTPNTCNQVIQGRLDTGYTPSDYRYFANLECHETGHGVGLQHGSGSIMNPSILLVWPLTWVGSYSFANLKRWFGGVPIPTDNPPPPPPPPPADYNGTFIYGGKLFKIKVYE